jgi:hypothetical protein
MNTVVQISRRGPSQVAWDLAWEFGQGRAEDWRPAATPGQRFDDALAVESSHVRRSGRL